ncbi:neo-calmodulin-like [Dreissena polymorpha]|uniref:neo-calmodulin-like n=1 Tax=Dreissena polymorpha TaxID=45954 RepID=UPI00226478FF|nr:neo-calmodulin-like [Dreissena polymorpha]
MTELEGVGVKVGEAKKLSSKELKELRKTFQMFDRNGDGRISASELSQAFRVQGQCIPEAEIRSIIREVDDDGNGQIDFEEFVSLMTTKSQDARSATRDESELREAFKVFDQNGDGKISCKELKAVLNSIGEKMTEREFAALIREADIDGDGSISFDEFSKVIANKFV